MSHLELIILVTCFVLVSCFANNMVCRPVEDACADDMRQHLHGPPGKLGPRGEKGNKGETGLPGVKGHDGLVNQSRIQENIKQEVESATRELTQRLESTESKLGDVSAVLRILLEEKSEDACADDRRQHLHGPPGKLGPKGSKGETGLPGVKGHEGFVNHTRTHETIKQEVESATRELTQRLESTESKLDDVRAILGILLEDKSECKVKYEGTCYRALVHPKYDVKYSNALSFCRMHGMEPAEIPSESHYYKIMECVRAEIPSEASYADIFTGMTYNHSARDVTLSDGTSAPFVKLYRNPSSSTAKVGMAIVVRSDVSHQGHGMYNVYSTTLQGIVCQKKNC
ncbi:uncharacterized protein LOC120334084 [Styela clava]